MSRFHERVKQCLCNVLADYEVIMLWNCFAEKNHYEQIYDMRDIDEIVLGDRATDEAQCEFAKNFSPSKKYFYEDSVTGRWKSSNNPVAAIADLDLLAADLIDSEGSGYPTTRVNDILRGTAFAKEMGDIINSLSLDKLRLHVILGNIAESTDVMRMSRDELRQALFTSLEDALIDKSPGIVYRMPEKIQSKFFEFMDPDLSYIKHNIGVKGPIDPEKALKLAGFMPTGFIDLYIQHGNPNHRYNIKIKDGVIKSAAPYRPKKHESVR